MRTSFELKLVASNIEEAKALAISEVSRFLQIPEDQVDDKVSLELKISYPKAESLTEIESTLMAEVFQVTVFGSVKQGVAKPFGF